MSICSTPLVFSLWAILPEDTTKLHCSQRNQEETLISNRSTQRRWSTQSKDTKITTCSTPFHLAISSGDLLQPFTNQFIANRRLNNCQAPNRKKNIVSYLLYKITSKHLPPTPQLSSQSQKTWNFIQKKRRFFGHLNLKKSCFGPLLWLKASRTELNWGPCMPSILPWARLECFST